MLKFCDFGLSRKKLTFKLCDFKSSRTKVIFKLCDCGLKLILKLADFWPLAF